MFFIGTVRRFLCWIKVHSFTYEHTHHDGASQHAQCKWCGYEGMVDSQGNLF